MPAYAAFGDQKYLQPDSSAAIVVPDTGIYTVFEGETDPGIYFARWNAPGGIYFISAQIQPCEGGGFWFAPKADSSDGNLEVCIVSHASKRQVLGTLLRALFRRSHNRGLRCFSCREVQIYTERPMAVHVDGESCQYQSNLEVRCIERKLKIVG